MGIVERLDLFRIAPGLLGGALLVLLFLLLFLLLLLGELPNDKDHEMDSDEEVRWREQVA